MIDVSHWHGDLKHQIHSYWLSDGFDVSGLHANEIHQSL